MRLQLKFTPEFERWREALRDERARARVASRLSLVERGLLGDHRSVGGGVHELRIDYGPGYRLYFVRRGQAVVILLWGGDKRSQQRDIARAIGLAETWVQDQ